MHKASISVAVADGVRGGAVRHLGSVPNRPDHIRKLLEKLASAGAQLHFCYEVGPCGYGLHRQLVEMGHDCSVIAPSLIGDRIKTDRRDAVMLAKLHRAGELTAVWVSCSRRPEGSACRSKKAGSRSCQSIERSSHASPRCRQPVNIRPAGPGSSSGQRSAKASHSCASPSRRPSRLDTAATADSARRRSQRVPTASSDRAQAATCAPGQPCPR